MALRIIKGRIKNRRDLKDTLSSNNPLLYEGELCLEQDTNKLKIGDGITRWNDLPYISAGGGVTGEVTAFAGKEVPEEWLLCNGQAVSRTDYADLFAVIGTTYGNGDGHSTFNVPNLNAVFIEATTNQSQINTVLSPAIPNITGNHVVDDHVIESHPYGGAFCYNGWQRPYDASSENSYSCGPGYEIEFDASRCSSVYKNNCTTVQPPAIMMYYIIKT